MEIGNVGDRGGFSHVNLQGHNRGAEPEERARGGEDRRDTRGPPSADDGGPDGMRSGDGWRTGGNNQASPRNDSGQGPQGRDGHHGNQDNYGNGTMNTGGRAPAGLLDAAPGLIHQLGNSLFSTASAVHNLLRNGDGQPAQRNVAGPPAHANASAHAHAHAHPGADARADARMQAPGMAAPTAAMNASQAMFAARTGTSNAFAAPGSAAPGTTAGAGMAATTALAMAQQTAAMPQRTLVDAPLLAQQGRPVADAAMPARADAATLAAARAAATAPATAPAPPSATLPAASNAPAVPPGNPQALAAAGLTVATVSVIPPGDAARGVVLPTHDAATSQRAESILNPAGHTLDGAQRRSLRNRLAGSMPEGRLARLLWAMGALGHTANGREPGAERTVQRALQWLFWILALVAYGCLAAAIVVFVGSDGRLMDSVADRNSTTWLAMCGLGVGVVAWGVARWISRRR